MKKLSKLSLAIIAPTLTLTPLISLTSCGDYWSYIDPQIKLGEYVNGINHTNILMYDSFTIRLSNPAKGYEQFDTSKTKITIGGKDVKYTLTDPTTIVVPAESVTSSDIKLYVEGKETCQDVKVSWSDDIEDRFDLTLHGPQCHVKDDLGEADTIKYSDLKVQALWGNPEKKDWRTVDISDSGFDIFYMNYAKSAYEKITDSFKKDGYTFSEKDFKVDKETGEKKQTQFWLAFRYKTNTFEKQMTIFDGLAGEVCYHTKSITISKKPDGDKVKCGKTFMFEATIEPKLAPVWYSFEMVDDGGTGSYFNSWTLHAGNTPGTIKVRATALPREKTYSEPYEITIEA